MILTAINARSLKAAYQAFREHFPAGHAAKALRDDQLKRLLDGFVERHPHLKDALGADHGIRLMHPDSQIARLVVNQFTQQGIPVLCIHDSFLIDQGHEDQLAAVMADASAEVLGGPFETSSTPPSRIWDPRYDGLDCPPGQPRMTEGYPQRLGRLTGGRCSSGRLQAQSTERGCV